MISRIEEKRNQLKEINATLKSMYKGIDEAIDKIIELIETWWIYDDLLYKPTIICLWGMTGIGKTSLVRDLVKLLNMYEKYSEIDISNPPGERVGFFGSEHLTPLGRTLYSKIKDTTEKSVLLIDEIGKIKGPTNQYYNDVWNLLSDGKLGTGHFALKRIDSMIDNLKSNIDNYIDTTMDLDYMRMAAGEQSSFQEQMMAGRWNPFEQPIPIGKRYIIDDFIRNIKIESFDQLDPIFDYIDFVVDQNVYPFGYRSILRKAYKEGKINIEKILHMPGLVYVKPLMEIAKRYKEDLIKKYNQVTSKDPTILSKLLIFIVGNIDSLYEVSDDTEISADDLHNKTTKISFEDLKKELVKVFAPREVSRFGNNHIIYPSLSSEAFKSIIINKLSQIEIDTETVSGIKVNLTTKKYIDYIYDNCLVATQGARHLISGMYSEVNTAIPELVKMATDKGLKEISVDTYLKSKK